MNSEVAYFGDKGSFASLVAKKRYANARLVPIPTVGEVAEYVQKKKNRLGIVPIENSSGGFIYETVDALVNKSHRLFIQEELGIHVRLALLGRKGDEIKHIYSHFAPIHHCGEWIRKNHPGAELHKVTSTSQAAQLAAHHKHSAALSTRDSAVIYGLDILKYPVRQPEVNMTQFFALGLEPNPRGGTETSFAVTLKNESGSLYRFLKPFSDAHLNLKRMISRNVMGHPNTYVFFVCVEANEKAKPMQHALKKAWKHSLDIRTLGSYPTRKPYSS